MTTKDLTAADLKAEAAKKLGAAVDLYRAALQLVKDPQFQIDPNDDAQWNRRKELLWDALQKPVQTLTQWDCFDQVSDDPDNPDATVFEGVADELRNTVGVRVQYPARWPAQDVLPVLRFMMGVIEHNAGNTAQTDAAGTDRAALDDIPF